MLLVRPEDSTVPLFDTTALHARSAVDAGVNQARRNAGSVRALHFQRGDQPFDHRLGIAQEEDGIAGRASVSRR